MSSKKRSSIDVPANAPAGDLPARPLYEPPVILDLGELARGVGICSGGGGAACAAGSNFLNTCTNGNSFGGVCDAGQHAAATCTVGGGNPG